MLRDVMAKRRRYTSKIPPPREVRRYMESDPIRPSSPFRMEYYTTPEVMEREKREARKKGILTAVIHEDYLEEVMHRVQRPTLSRRMKYFDHLGPVDQFICCPETKVFTKHIIGQWKKLATLPKFYPTVGERLLLSHISLKTYKNMEAAKPMISRVYLPPLEKSASRDK